MNKRHLFLFGGSPPFGDQFGEKFANLALNEKGKVAILFVARDGWQDYMKIYTSVLAEYGHREFEYLPLNPQLEKENTMKLATCTGIIISGGETEVYRERIVDTSIGMKIKELYKRGVPVAGFSAGALISPEHCIIPPIDNKEEEHLFLTGIGLINHAVISVHYSKWNEEENLKANVAKMNVPIGYGMDDDTGAYFENEEFVETEGEGFHVFQNRDV